MVIRDELHYMNKIDMLRTKGETQNAALINKCLRKIRMLENKVGA